MAVHGVSRSTRDLDLLTLAGEGLGDAVWEPLRQQGIGVHIRRGDATDPLAGVVRFTEVDASLDKLPPDCRGLWQRIRST
ncbi:MAG: hypothetical protein HY614_06255 [Candidatus Rokubacteria bacterium]|nr:hypothetical protein [Candidatus Rokubacteria bacterium]